MSETRTITLPVYRTPDGEPTCARNFSIGEVCELLRVGVVEGTQMCAVATHVVRYLDGFGYLIPAKDCPLWRPCP